MAEPFLSLDARERADILRTAAAHHRRSPVTRPFATLTTSAVRLLTSPRPASLRVQRMRSPARSSISSAR